jgi:hypothetical protein
MILCLLGGFWIHRDHALVYVGDNFVNWILLALLGWKVYGPPVKAD